MADQDRFFKATKPKTREVSSRFLSSPSSTPTHDHTKAPSPMRQKHTAVFDTKRHQRTIEGSLRWPSATAVSYSSRHSTEKIDTLADHLGNERLKEMMDGGSALLLNRQRSCSEISRFEIGGVGGKKENHRPILGGSMRYTGKESPSPFPGRFSVDEKTSIRKSDHFFDSESECSEMSRTSNVSSSSKKSGVDVPSRYMTSKTRRSIGDEDSAIKPQKFTIKGAIKRASSITGYRSAAGSQWALSPGRTGSPPVRAVSLSAMKPPSSPSRQNGVEKLLNMGLDLFKTKKSSPSGHGSVESVHQIRLLHNRLIQWRTVNARASVSNRNLEEQAERNLVCAWGSLAKLRHSVVQKRLQLEKRRLEAKLNFILDSQMKPLEEWREMEGRHCSAVSRTAECLHSVVCRVPLKDGAEADPESTSYALRHASALTSAVKLNLNALAPPAEEAVPMLVELAKVVGEEKRLLEECLEHIRNISTLEVQEWSLMSSMLQLSSWLRPSRTEDY